VPEPRDVGSSPSRTNRDDPHITVHTGRNSISLPSSGLVVAECLSASASHDSLRYLDPKHESAPRLGVKFYVDSVIRKLLDLSVSTEIKWDTSAVGLC
jgi:hypothetical protein